MPRRESPLQSEMVQGTLDMLVLQRAKSDRERREELESYIRVETDNNVALGMLPEAARAAAQRKLGNSTLIREEIYRMNTIGFLDSLSRDLRDAVRSLRHNPGFA